MRKPKKNPDPQNERDQLLKANSILNAVIEGTSDAIFIKDIAGCYLMINQAGAQFIGKPVAEILGHDDTALFKPESARSLMEVDRYVMDQGVTLTNESLLKTAERTRVYQSVKWPYRNESDEVIGLIGISRDITEKKQAEAVLLDREERLRAALSASSTGTFRWDFCTSTLTCDDNFARLFGLESGGDITRLNELIERVHADDRRPVVACVERSALKGHDLDMEFRVVWQDGSIHWLVDKGKTIFDDEGQPLYMTGACVDITDRKSANEEQHRKLALLIENSNDMFGLVGSDQKLSFINRAGQKIIGMEQPEDVTKTSLLSLLPEFEQDKFRSRIFPDLLKNGNWEGEIHLRHLKSGKFIPVIWHLFTLPENKTEGAFAFVAVDITERKKGEESLNFAMNAAEMGGWDLDFETYSIRRSFRHDQIYGYRDGLPSWSYADFLNHVDPADRDLINLKYQEAMESGLLNVEFRILWPDGTRHWVAQKGRVFYDSVGKMVRMAGVVMEITQRKMAEQALRESEEFNRRILESSSDCIQILDLDGGLLDMNYNGQCQMEISDLNRYRNRSWLDFWNESDKDTARKAIATAKNGGIGTFQARYESPTGAKKWWDVLITPIQNAAGHSERLLAVSRDITNQKKSEKTLLRAKEAADLANQAKSIFLANISHEIRTPLSAILGYADFLMDPTQPEGEKLEWAQTIKRNGEQLLKLINDVLDISKVEAQKLEVEKAKFSLTELFEDVLKTLDFASREKGLSLNVFLEPPIPAKIRSDSARLKQILLNLIGNAIKFTAKGHIDVKVRLVGARHPSDPAKLKFVIKDTGVGLSEEQQSKLFQPFSQGDASIARQYGGSGLGLALSRNIARMLGGDLVLTYSAPGEGSIFTLTIDAGIPSGTLFQEGAAPQVKASAHSAYPESFSRHELEGFHLLLAEDAPDNQKLLSKVLRHLGAKVDVASDGKEAVAKALNDQYDAVLMDIQMPGLDGYCATQKLRTQGYDKPIIALTAHAMREERERTLKAGFNDYVTKPIDRRTLLTALKKAVKFH